MGTDHGSPVDVPFTIILSYTQSAYLHTPSQGSSGETGKPPFSLTPAVVIDMI